MTPEQRLQVFMLYPNAKILLHGDVYEVFGWDIGRLTLKDENGLESVYHDECQLILRGIDQLTEEEKRELLKMVTKNSGVTYDHLTIGGVYLHFDNNVEGRICEVYSLPLFMSDYLRSKNIALPYMGIDLFEEGIAVREN